MKKITIITLLLFTTMIGYAQKESGANYIVDDIEYKTDSPTTIDIELWIQNHRNVCSTKNKHIMRGYEIPAGMKMEHPCLVYLILTSKSIYNMKEKQQWFDLYPLMNEEQIMNLYVILYKERYKLAELNSK